MNNLSKGITKDAVGKQLATNLFRLWWRGSETSWEWWDWKEPRLRQRDPRGQLLHSHCHCPPGLMDTEALVSTALVTQLLLLLLLHEADAAPASVPTYVQICKNVIITRSKQSTPKSAEDVAARSQQSVGLHAIFWWYRITDDVKRSPEKHPYDHQNLIPSFQSHA